MLERGKFKWHRLSYSIVNERVEKDFTFEEGGNIYNLGLWISKILVGPPKESGGKKRTTRDKVYVCLSLGHSKAATTL